MYQKERLEIKYIDFLKLIEPINSFKSCRGAEYIVKTLEGDIMYFVRKSSGKLWSMNLKQILIAYKELSDFKTINFKPYVPLTHSPALGLLLHTGLLVKIERN